MLLGFQPEKWASQLQYLYKSSRNSLKLILLALLSPSFYFLPMGQKSRPHLVCFMGLLFNYQFVYSVFIKDPIYISFYLTFIFNPKKIQFFNNR